MVETEQGAQSGEPLGEVFGWVWTLAFEADPCTVAEIAKAVSKSKDGRVAYFRCEAG